MPDLKTHYDRYLLAAAGLLAAGIAALLVFASGAAREVADVPAPPVRKEPFAPNEAVETLRADRAAMDAKRDWRESESGGSPFVSRVYLLKDGRLVDILEAGNDLFPGITNAWILDNGLDYQDLRLPERDPDSDGFTNLEEFKAKTNPRDAASLPDERTKLRLSDLKIELLELVLKTPIMSEARAEAKRRTDSSLDLQLFAEGTYENPPDSPSGAPRPNPPSFLGKSVQARFGAGPRASEVIGAAKVTKEEISPQGNRFRIWAEIPFTKSANPMLFEQIAATLGDKQKTNNKFYVLVGAWINSQSSNEPGKLKGQSATYLLGQNLYVNRFVSGRADPESEEAPFKLADVSSESKDAPQLGKAAKVEVFQASLSTADETARPTLLQQDQMKQNPYSLATLSLEGVASQEPILARVGKVFALGNKQYKLIDVSEEQATIEETPTGTQFPVPRGAQAAPQTGSTTETQTP